MPLLIGHSIGGDPSSKRLAYMQLTRSKKELPSQAFVSRRGNISHVKLTNCKRTSPMAQEEPFRFLDKQQFEKLSQAERIAYLKRATAELTRRGQELRELSRRNGPDNEKK